MLWTMPRGRAHFDATDAHMWTQALQTTGWSTTETLLLQLAFELACAFHLVQLTQIEEDELELSTLISRPVDVISILGRVDATTRREILQGFRILFE